MCNVKGSSLPKQPIKNNQFIFWKQPFTTNGDRRLLVQAPQAGIRPRQVSNPKLEFPTGLMCMFWDGVRKLEHLEETHTERPELELWARENILYLLTSKPEHELDPSAG